MTIDLQNNYIWGIPPYTFMIGIGLACSLTLFLFLLYDSKIKIDKQLFIYALGAVGVFIGAKLFGCIKNVMLVMYNHDAFSINIIKASGLVYYGGLTGFLAFASLAMILLYHKIDKQLMNLVAITIPVFHGFGRIGCLFAGCCYGKEYNGLLSIIYLSSSGEKVARFPTQLIEAIFEICIFICLFVLYRKSKKINLLKVYLVIYAIMRFILEFTRGDSIRGMFGFLSFSQYISIGILIILIISIILKRKKDKEVLNYENC